MNLDGILRNTHVIWPPNHGEHTDDGDEGHSDISGARNETEKGGTHWREEIKTTIMCEMMKVISHRARQEKAATRQCAFG